MSTLDLERRASCVVMHGKLRKAGKSLDRYRSYLAGRCAIEALFASLNARHYIKSNVPYGYLEVIDESGHVSSNYFVNVSHTAQIAVAVISNTPVGVDIEDSGRSAERVLPRIACDEEIRWVGTTGETVPGVKVRRDIFLWSAKEAVSKAFGLGMKFGFRAFQIFPSAEEGVFFIRSDISGPLTLKEPMLCYLSWESYFITVVSEKNSVLRGVNRRILSSGEF